MQTKPQPKTEPNGERADRVAAPNYLMWDQAAINAATLADEYVANAPHALNLGFKLTDRELLPISTTNLVTVMANTGHGKSTFLNYLARYWARKFRDVVIQGRKPLVLVVTGEEAVERRWFSMLNKPDITMRKVILGQVTGQAVAEQSYDMTGHPVAFIGLTMARKGAYRLYDENGQVIYQDITVDMIRRAIDHIESHPTPEGRWEVRAVVADYAQAFSTGDHKMDLEPVTRVSVVSDELMALAAQINGSVTVGAQSNPDMVNGRSLNDRIPYENDCWNSRRLPMRSDGVICLSIPAKYTRMDGTTVKPVKMRGQTIPITPDLMLAGFRKWREASSGLILPLSMGGGHFPGARPFGDLAEVIDIDKPIEQQVRSGKDAAAGNDDDDDDDGPPQPDLF